MIRSPKFWFLFVLLVGPIAVYVFFGFLWLAQTKHWALYGFIAWIAASLLFGIFSVRWTRAKGQSAVLPPIDWSSPRTFSPFDLQAWKLVEEESNADETLPIEKLTEIDSYLETGKRLAFRLAAHYHPLSADPLDQVPLVQVLTALELAAEDLNGLCLEVPGVDMMTSSFWKKAVQAAGFFQKANEFYGYLLPLFSPAQGLARLGAAKLMTGPAWKNMQQNLLRWFYRAYVNRLGIHLIELYSGRLVIGADQYRKLTKKKVAKTVADTPKPLEIAVIGAKGSGRSSLIAALTHARAEGIATLRGKLQADGLDENLADLLAAATWMEVDGYTIRPGTEAARDRATRRKALNKAVQADLVLLLIDAQRDDLTPDVKFLESWSEFFAKNSTSEIPPLVVVLSHIDALGERSLAEAKIQSVRKTLPASFVDLVSIDLATVPPRGVADRLLIGLVPLLEKAERVGMIRRIQEVSNRSKARRLADQVARQGKRLFSRN